MTLSAIVLLGSAVTQIVSTAQEPPHQLTVQRRDYDMRLLLTPTSLSEAALKGRATWVQRCALCHDGVGQPTYDTFGPWLDGDIVRSMGDARVREKIVTGSARMPGFQYSLSSAQLDELLAFLKTVTPDQKPTADQKAKKSPR